MAKRTKITIETESLSVLCGRGSQRAWCPRCGAEMAVICLEDAGVLSNLEHSELHEWFSKGELHSWQNSNGSTQICVRSLLQCFERGGVRKLPACEDSP